MANEGRQTHPLTRALQSLFLIGLCLGLASLSPVGAGSSSAPSPLAEANTEFTFKGRPIHPGLVKEFQNWLSDYRPPITVTLDVGAAYDTNEYADAVTPAHDGGVSVITGDGGERFSYRRLGRLDNGVHVLHTRDKSAGTGIFQSLTFVRFHLDPGFDRDGIKPSKRLLMSVVRVYAIVGPKTPDIRITGNDVRIKSGARVTELKFNDP